MNEETLRRQNLLIAVAERTRGIKEGRTLAIKEELEFLKSIKYNVFANSDRYKDRITYLKQQILEEK